MKKKFLTFILCICFIIPAMFCLSACSNENKTDSQNFRVKDGWVQFTQDGETWINLIEAEYPISEYDFRIYNGYVQWTTDGETWTDLIKIEEKKSYTITYDYGVAKDLFGFEPPETSIIEENTWVMSLPKIYRLNEPSFKGWFIQGTDKQITEYDYIAGDVTLEARFDFTDSYAPSGLYKNGKFINTWQQLIEDENVVVEDGVLTYGFVQGDLKIDNTIIKIGEKAFDDNMQWLTGVAIPDSVKQIGSNAFDNCIDLETVIMGKGVEIIEDSAFSSCDKLINLVIGENVQIINKFAFSHCIQLSNIIIPNRVLMLNEQAFMGCKKLTFVNLNVGLSETWKIYNQEGGVISQNAMLLTERQVAWYLQKGYNFRQVYTNYQGFDYVLTNSKTIIISAQDKSALYNEKISNGVNSRPLTIADYAFAQSENLHTVTITEDVEYIGHNAFINCNNLTTITFEEKDGYKWQVYENDSWRDAQASELFDLAKSGKKLKRIAE